MTRADTGGVGVVPHTVLLSWQGVRVLETVFASLITGVLTLAGVLASNSRARAVLEEKVDALARHVEKHNGVIERTYKLEQDVAVVRAELENLKEGK